MNWVRYKNKSDNTRFCKFFFVVAESLQIYSSSCYSGTQTTVSLCKLQWENKYKLGQNQAIPKDGKHKKTYPSIKKATQVTRINGSHIIACARGKRKQGGEYVWRYEGMSISWQVTLLLYQLNYFACPSVLQHIFLKSRSHFSTRLIRSFCVKPETSDD